MIKDKMVKKWWVIPATLAAGIVFLSIPAGPSWQNYNPDWISLVLIYWCFATPGRINLTSAWLTGIFLDVVTFGVLGRYALSKFLIILIARRLALRVRIFPLWQQSLVILVLLLLESLVLILADFLIIDKKVSYGPVIGVVIGAVIWAPLYFVLRKIRHWARLP